jgi:hypothetical protein
MLTYAEAAGRDPLHAASSFARLYAPDGLHPSRLGSFLTACIFYGVISGKSPQELSFFFKPQGAELSVVCRV